jgi:hypothetical protein
VNSQEPEPAGVLALEALNATAIHVRRIVGLISVAVGRSAREVRSLLWDYQDLAGELHRRRPGGESQLNLGPLELYWSAPGSRAGVPPDHRPAGADVLDVSRRRN